MWGLIADGRTGDDLAEAESVLRDDCQLDSDGDVIRPLRRRWHLDDALVGTPDLRLALLDETTAADVAR